MIAEDAFLEYDAHMDNYYGTPKGQLEDKLQKGSVILDIEPNGAFNVRKEKADAVLIFIAPPSMEELERRLRGRNDTTEEQLAEVYATQIKGLIDGGVDLILIETAMDAANVRIAVEQVRKLSPEMPIIVSAVLSRLEGRVASGATIAKFVEELPMEELLSVGFNCSMGDKQQAAALKALSVVSNKPVVLYPALSQPQEAPNRFLKPLDTLMRAGGVNIIGGCCGTTPAHIEALAKAAARWRPRKIE